MEAPFGFEFEESVFEGSCRSRNGRASLPLAYSARRCEPEWFCEETSCEDDAETANVKKFRGDLAYKQQAFKKALCEYSGCLTLLPPSNLAMRRDVQESQARCLAHLGRQMEALEITETLGNGATNTDHVTVVLRLRLAIYRTVGHVAKMIECLHGLIMLHPFHPENWKLLGEAYMRLWQAPGSLQGDGAPEESSPHTLSNEANLQSDKKYSWGKEASLQFSPQSSCEQCQRTEGPISTSGKPEAQPRSKSDMFDSSGQEGSEIIRIYSCASFVRARLLFQLMQFSQSSFALECNLKAQQEIEDKIASFGLKESFLSLMTETMGEDLIPEKLKEDAQGEVRCLGPSALTSAMTVSSVEFKRKWFQRLGDQFSPSDCH
ncbi:hypothetical protein EYD10_07105, partial [Varanus komodoensis]